MVFLLFIGTILLLVFLIQRQQELRGRASTTGTTYTSEKKFSIPSVIENIPECNENTKLAQCINRLLEEKKVAEEKVIITIEPGEYTLDYPIIIFQKNGVEIRGESAISKPHIVVALLDSSTPPKRQVDKKRPIFFYTINIIDSQDITIDNIDLTSPPTLTGQRAIVACPTKETIIRGITISRNVLSDFTAYNVLLGRVYSEEMLEGVSKLDDVLADSDPTLAAEKRFISFLKNDPNNRVCGGGVSDVVFKDNTINMRTVGFYTDPYTAYQTRDYTIKMKIPGENPTIDEKTNEWNVVEERATSLSANYQVTGNRFVTRDNLSEVEAKDYLHSAIKIQGNKNFLFENNTITTGTGVHNLKVFGAGAGLNIASGMEHVSVSNNEFIFDQNHQYKVAINIHNYFGYHKWFGLGRDKLTVPAKNIYIESNKLINSRIAIPTYSINFDPQYINACLSTSTQSVKPVTNSFGQIISCPTGSTEDRDDILLLTEYLSREMDASQSSGNPKANEIYIYENSGSSNGISVENNNLVVYPSILRKNYLDEENSKRSPDVRFIVRANPGVSLTVPSITSGSVPLIGDLNKDTSVDLLDYMVWYCETRQDRECTMSGRTTTFSDLDHNERVDLIDFQLWKNAYISYLLRLDKQF